MANRNLGNVRENNIGYIEEKIKVENLGKWMNSSYEVDEFGRTRLLNNSLFNQQSFSKHDDAFGNQEATMRGNEEAMNQAAKKKIPRKKSRSNSKSLKKRSG